jgi:ABC-type molybdenum transport system ATPase subunit/photorepair protein PhrA
MALLDIDDVVAGYGTGPDILTGISLSIEPDRSTCIIGPNGAGKSTLLKAICGLVPTVHRLPACAPTRCLSAASASCRRIAASSRT